MTALVDAGLPVDKLYVNNCFDVFPRLKPKSARLVMGDPPYEVSRPNNLTTMGRTGIDFDWDKNFDQVGWLLPASELLMDGGSFVIWNDWKKLGLIAEALTALNFDVKRKIMWIKSNPAVRNRDRSFTQAHEDALWAIKKAPGKRGKWVFNRRAGIGAESGIFRYPIVPTKPGVKRHPAAKPPALLQEIIEILTRPGELVVDPFAGGCPTAKASRDSGRHFICIEKDVQWVKNAPCSIATVDAAPLLSFS